MSHSILSTVIFAFFEMPIWAHACGTDGSTFLLTVNPTKTHENLKYACLRQGTWYELSTLDWLVLKCPQVAGFQPPRDKIGRKY